MKFLVDAQLPRTLAVYLQSEGYDAIHTLDLPDANASTDGVIVQIATAESRIVVTKDGDFVDSFLLSRSPAKLLHITTGNITNRHLLDLFSRNTPLIVQLFDQHSYIELSRDSIVVHV